MYKISRIQGYDNEDSHPDFSEFSIRISLLGTSDFLKEMGMTGGVEHEINGVKIWDWARVGAILEDAGSDTDAVFGLARFKNHFHDPLKDWSEAGLSDAQKGMSMVLWAQDPFSQLGAIEGDWSWQTIRNRYLLALTMETEAEREEYFAKTFRGLGHQMHLIQDAGQPDHVRNDAHPLDGKGWRIHVGFEKWIKDNRSGIKNDYLIENSTLKFPPVYPSLNLKIPVGEDMTPIAKLIDANLYNGMFPSGGTTQGLAEYTNSNFFSDNTIFAAERFSPGDKHYFPYPKASSTNLREYLDGPMVPEMTVAPDGTEEFGIWIKKDWNGEVVDHLVRPSYFSKIIANLSGEGELFYSSFYRDEKCHIDYAQKLIPRAVGYSAALVNYFFRGKIDMEPDSGNSGQYVIKNDSDEEMSGAFRLHYDDTNGMRKLVPGVEWSEWNLNIPANGKSIPVTFTAPTDAKEPGKYMLVFHGTHGVESGAVVGKVVELKSGPEARVVTVSGSYISAYVNNKMITARMPSEGLSSINSVRFDVNDWNTFVVMATYYHAIGEGCKEFHKFTIDPDNLTINYGGLLQRENYVYSYSYEQVYNHVWPNSAGTAGRNINGVEEYSLADGIKVYLTKEYEKIIKYVDFFLMNGDIKPFGTIEESSRSWLTDCGYHIWSNGDGNCGSSGDKFILEDVKNLNLYYENIISKINNSTFAGNKYV